MSDVETETEVSGLNPGKVYFMCEEDLRTGERFPYYKIGKVCGEKDVAKREKEHQTGNPRRIRIHDEIVTKMAKTLETTLHNRFALNRVHSGEWFEFDESSIALAIDLAKKLNAEIERNAEAIRFADDLEAQVSRDELKAAPSGAGDLALTLARTKATATAIAAAGKAVADHIVTLAGTNGFDKVAERRLTKERSSFDSAAFKKAHPELAAKFATKPRFEHRFLNKVKSDALLIEGDALGAAAEPDALVKLDLFEAHLEFLRLWQLREEFATPALFFEAQLKTMVEDFAGIDGVCTWNRKHSFSFDSDAFKAIHPELAEIFTKVTPASSYWKIVEWKSYR